MFTFGDDVWEICPQKTSPYHLTAKRKLDLHLQQEFCMAVTIKLKTYLKVTNVISKQTKQTRQKEVISMDFKLLQSVNKKCNYYRTPVVVFIFASGVDPWLCFRT